MYEYSTGTFLNRMAKLSLPVQAFGCVRRVRTPAAQDTAVEDSIFYSDENTSLLSCSGMMNDYDMHF